MGYNRGSAFMLYLMLFFLGYSLLLSLFIDPYYPPAVLSSPLFFIAQHGFILLLPLCIWTLFHRERIKTWLPAAPLGKRNVILIFFISIFLQPAMMLLSGLASLFMPNPVTGLMQEMTARPLILLILAFAVSPAVFEEVVFRGYIQSAFRSYPIKTAALINGFFFAAIHMNLHQFFYAFAMGMVFAYLVHYTKSIRAAVLAHFVMNASQILMMRLAERLTANAEEVYITFQAQAAAIMQIGFVALLFTPCAVILYRVFKSHNNRRNISNEINDVLKGSFEIHDDVLTEVNEKFDPYLIGVVVMFFLLAVLPIFS